jgi:hypothetical protein
MKKIFLVWCLTACQNVNVSNLPNHCDKAHVCQSNQGCFCGECRTCADAGCDPCSLNASLRTWISFDGTSALDCTGGDKPAQLSNGTASTTDASFGKGWMLKDQEVLLPFVTLGESKPASLSFFFRVDQSLTSDLYEERLNDTSLILRLEGLALFLVDGTARTSLGQVTAGSAVHVVLVRNTDAAATIYINGVSSNVSFTPLKSSYAVLGPGGNAGRGLTVDELRSYDRALTKVEVDSLRVGQCANSTGK